MKHTLTLLILTILSLTGFSQTQNDPPNNKETYPQTKAKTYTYAYILVEGRLFSKKLKVKVDLGDSSEQLKEGEEHSRKLTDKKSYAAILNYMVENQYELSQTLDYTLSSDGDGGTSGIVFIMKKPL